MPGGRPRDGDDEPGVVDELAVPAAHAAAQAVGAHRGCEAQRLGATDAAGARQEGARRPDGAAQAVPQFVAESDVGSANEVARPVQRHDLRQRAREMRCGAGEEDVPLEGALARDADLSGREVAQAPVHELRAEAARAVREVVPFDQDGAQAAARGIQCDPHPGDAAADDEQIDLALVGERLELPCAPAMQ